MLAAAPAATADPVTYKAPRHGPSPHDTVSAVVGGGRVALVYGRPRTADPKTGEERTVWGGKLVPVGKIWRAGADEATLLITQKAMMLGEGASALKVPAGAHTLFVFPESADSLQLVVNDQIGQWGLQYDGAKDLGRVPLQKDPLSPPLHQFTMAVEKTGAKTGVIRLLWEDAAFSAPFTVAE